MTSGRNIWLAGICAASTLCTLALGTIWLRLGQQVWHRLRQRQRPWFLFWNYALPVLVAIPTLASLSDDVVPVDQRFLAAAATGAVLACIYRLIYLKNKNMRKKIVAGNWKMNTLPAEGVELAENIRADRNQVCSCVNFIVCPPFTHLGGVIEALRGSDIEVGAQNCAAEDKGAYTGEVSAAMLAALGCRYVILGHSERRQYYGETSATLNKKMAQAFANGLQPIYCVGENLEEREADRHFDVVKTQIEEVIYNLTPAQFARTVIAYEPVWAIGTGKTATAEQAQEIHAYIRTILREKFGAAADETPILYGGSCKRPGTLRQRGRGRRPDRRSGAEGRRFPGYRQRFSAKIILCLKVLTDRIISGLFLFYPKSLAEKKSKKSCIVKKTRTFASKEQ